MNISSEDISDFLLQNKTISLEKIGQLDIGNKEETGIFTYDKTAITSPELYQYLAEKKGKALIIIMQDVEYFLDQARQLMNIRAGNLRLGEIGYIYADNSGKYAFSTDSSEEDKKTDRRAFDDMYAKSPLTSSINYAIKSNRRPWRIIATIIILAAIVAYGAYYIHKTPSLFSDNNDSSKTIQEKISDVQPKNQLPEQPASENIKGFKFIIQTFEDAASCQKRAQQLKNYGNEVFKDTLTVAGTPIFRLYVTDTAAFAKDTTHIKDSLRAYFGYPVSVERANKQ